MPTFKIEIEYDGSRYRGWRMEHNQRTVQGEMMVVARQLFENRVELSAAEDTEPGVHARSNILHLKAAELTEDITPRQIMDGFNELLPHDINILKFQNADEDFNAWKDATARQYLYQISTRRTAFAKNFVWWNKDKVNLREMKNAVELVRGKLNLVSFAEVEDGKRTSTNVLIEKAEISAGDDMILIRVRANHFLPKTFLRLVGNLAEVGRGNILVEDFQRSLKFKTDAAARFSAPPSGMFLEKIFYESK